jgi:hypothetical protein
MEFGYEVTHENGECVICKFIYKKDGYEAEILMGDVNGDQLGELIAEEEGSMTMHGDSCPYTVYCDKESILFVMEIQHCGGGYMSFSVPRAIGISAMQGMYNELMQIEAQYHQ